MILFFDRNTGTALPRALQLLKPPHQIEYHQAHFAPMTPDEEWLATIGERGWVVVAQDYRFHRRPHELDAIKRFGVGVFYLWGANASRWEIARVFMKAIDAIELAEATTPRPFVFRILKDGRLRSVTLR